MPFLKTRGNLTPYSSRAVVRIENALYPRAASSGVRLTGKLPNWYSLRTLAMIMMIRMDIL